MDISRFNSVSFVLTLSCLVKQMCYCLGKNVKNNLYNQTTTVYKDDTNKLHSTQATSLYHSVMKALNIGNWSEYNITEIENKTHRGSNYSDNSGDTELPETILIASLAVAVGIFIFICIAYKWHTVQLDSQAKELAAQMGSAHCPSPCIPCSPCHNSHRLLPPTNPININSPCLSERDLPGTRYKSLRTPSPILLSPPRLGIQRGSSWSALSDQEIISHSPRRHSTFLL